MINSWYYHLTGLHNHDFFDAVYYVVITVTTIGFGDIKFDNGFYTSLEGPVQVMTIVGDLMLFYINLALVASVINTLASCCMEDSKTTQKNSDNEDGHAMKSKQKTKT